MTDMSDAYPAGRPENARASGETPDKPLSGDNQENTGQAAPAWDARGLGIAAGIFVFALAVRLIYLHQSADNPTFDMPIVDSDVYDAMARAAVEGKGMPNTFFWQPFFYPFFLAVLYFFTDPSILAAKLVQVVLGAICCVLTFRLAERIFDRPTGVLAGVMTALCGPLIFFEAELLASGWAALWSVVLVLLFLKAGRDKTPRCCFALGVCGVLSILTRPTFLPFFLAGCIWLAVVFWRGAGRWGVLGRGAAALLAGVGLIALPVARLNSRLTGRFGILPSSGGINFYVGNNEDHCTTLTARPGSAWVWLTRMPIRHGVSGGMWEEQRFFYDEVARFMRTHPADFALGLVRKAGQLLNSREIPRNVDIYSFAQWSPLSGCLTWKKGGFGFPFGVLLPLAAVGLVCRRRCIPAPVVLFLVFYSLSIVAVFVTARYRVPLMPLVCVLAAAGAGAVVRMIQSRHWPRLAATLLGSTVLVLLSTLPGPFCEEEPNYDAELYYCLASVTADKGRVEEAIRHYRRALAINPDFVDAHNNLGADLLGQGKVEEAIVQFEEALRLNPDKHETHNNMAVARIRQGRIDEACRHLEEMLRLDPNDAKAHYNLANFLLNKKRLDEAITHYREAVRVKPDYVSAQKNLGVALMRQREYEDALRHHQAALRLDPDDSGAFANLVVTLVRLGRGEEAVRRCTKALESRPTNLEFNYVLGLALEGAGRLPEAVEQYQKLLQLNPNDARARRRLAALSAQVKGASQP